MSSTQIKAVRRHAVENLKLVYPGAMQAERLFNALLGPFPELEFDLFRQDLAYLVGKGYVERLLPKECDHPDLVKWRKRYFRLTPAGVEIADRVVRDPALEV